MTMEIGSAANISALQAAVTRQKIDISLLRKAMDISKAQGEAVLELLEGAAEVANQQPNQGSRHIDVKI